MKTLVSICQAFVIAAVISTLALGAEQIIRFDEKMVGAHHATLPDTLNRGLLIQHNAEGVHTIVPYAALTGVPTTFPWDNLTGKPTTLSGYGITDAASAFTAFPYDNLTGPRSSFPADNLTGQVAVANGGTGSDNAAGARTNLGADNASNLTNGTVAIDRGGFGQSVVGQNGVTYFTSGIVSWKTLTQFLALVGITFNSADNTWVFLAPATVTGNLTATGEIVAQQFSTTGTDNTFGINVMDTADPTGANLEAGLLWGPTDNVMKVRNADNTVTNTIPLAVAVPAAANSACTIGMVAFDNTYSYHCQATNAWMRASHATW